MKMPIWPVGKGAIAAGAALAGVLIAQTPNPGDGVLDVPFHAWQRSVHSQRSALDELSAATKRLINITINPGLTSIVGRYASRLLLDGTTLDEGFSALLAIGGDRATLASPTQLDLPVLPPRPSAQPVRE